MTDLKKATLFFASLVTFGALLIVAIINSSGPVVIGTECRTAGHNGDHLYLGKVNCDD